MNNSTLTIRTGGFRRLRRGYFRFCFPGFTLKKGLASRRLGLGWAGFGFWLIYSQG